jgi:hypothetical protein
VVDDHLTGVRLRDGTFVARQALAVSTRMVASAWERATLGLHPTAHPLGIGEFVVTGRPPASDA